MVRRNVLASILGALALGVGVQSCGVQPDRTIEIQDPPQPKTCDGLPLGSTRQEVCDAGYQGAKLYVCKENGWLLESNSCKKIPDQCETENANQPNWVRDIKPIVDAKCVQCHFSPQNFSSYDVVAANGFDLAKELVLRVQLDSNNPQRMPPGPANPVLPVAEREAFEKWKDAGYPRDAGDCSGKDPRGDNFIYQTLEEIEDAMLEDIKKLDDDGQVNTRYLILSHKYNTKSPVKDMDLFAGAIQKNMNVLNIVDDDLNLAVPIDRRQTIYRVDLREFRIAREKWERVLEEEPYNFISETQAGRELRNLTQTDQPWLHADNFSFTSLEAVLYNELAEIPLTQDEFYAQIGLDFQAEIDNEDAIFMGGNGSPISLQKNRLVVRMETEDDLWFYLTYDPIDINGVPERNLFEFPLIDETGSTRIFDFAAGEILHELPNGLMGVVLFNNLRTRQAEAPINVVFDTEAARLGLNPVISNGLSCQRCHASGMIPMVDQVRASVLRNAGNFDFADVELVRDLYKKQSSINAAFSRDNAEYGEKLRAIGIDPAGPDPINYLTDRHRREFTGPEVAAFVFLPFDEFKERLSEAPNALAQVPQLLTGGTISQVQLAEVFPLFIEELGIAEEDRDR